MRTTGPVRVAAVVVLGIVTLACGGAQRPQASPLPAKAILWFRGNDTGAVLPPDFGRLVRTEIFADLVPGQTASETAQRFGPPVTVTTDHAGTYYHYRRGGRQVALGHLTSSSFNVTWEDWSVFATPEPPGIEQVFHPPLVELLQGKTGDVVLLVAADGRYERLSARLNSDGKVQSVRWYRTSG